MTFRGGRARRPPLFGLDRYRVRIYLHDIWHRRRSLRSCSVCSRSDRAPATTSRRRSTARRVCSGRRAMARSIRRCAGSRRTASSRARTRRTGPAAAGSTRSRAAAGFLRERFLPLGAFYAAFQVGDLTTAIVASAAVALLIYLYERRAGREGLLVRLSLLFVVVQSVVGLAANSTTVYLAQPVLVAAAWGLAFLLSVPLGRPLAGSLACAWYPFPRSFRETAAFKRVFGIESLVWAGYFLARS